MKGLREMNSIYKESWLDSDLDSYLYYLDSFLSNGQANQDEESKPMSFETFRESIQA